MGSPSPRSFAGPGAKLGELCDRLGFVFTGTDIEPEYGYDKRVRGGDSVDASTYPTGEYCVFTSPTYANGMADQFHRQDGRKGFTYREFLKQITGYDRPLHEHNTGRYGLRGGQKALRMYWRLSRDAVAHWPDRVIVNVKDFPYENTKIYPLAAKWTELLEHYGYKVTRLPPVLCPGLREGENPHRVGTEDVLIGERDR